MLNTALSQSQFDSRTGQQLSLGYQYNSTRYSFMYQRVERRDDYADLTLVDTPYASLSKRSEQVTLSLNLQRFGSLGLGYFDVQAADDSRTHLLNLSWSKPLWRNTSFYLSANREIGDSNWAMQAQLVIPFDLNASLALSAERSKDGASRQRINYSRAVPSEGGWATTSAMPRAMPQLSASRPDLALAVGAVAGWCVRQQRGHDALGGRQRLAGMDGRRNLCR